MINLIVAISAFLGSSIPQGEASPDSPSGVTFEIDENYMVNINLGMSYYQRENYKLRLIGMGVGKEFFIFNNFSTTLSSGLYHGLKARQNLSETGFIPYISMRFLIVFPSKKSGFQIGFSMKEIFDEEIGSDFLNIGVGFRMQ